MIPCNVIRSIKLLGFSRPASEEQSSIKKKTSVINTMCLENYLNTTSISEETFSNEIKLKPR